MISIKDYLELFFVFFKIGSVTFGGGLAMLPFLERELIEKRNWTSRDTILDYYAISQITPGIIAVNVSTFIGYNRKGVAGGIVATLGMVAPSIIVISVIANFLNNFSDIVMVQKAFKGINIAVAALLTKVVFDFAKKSLKSAFTFILMISSFILVEVFKINIVIVIVLASVTGIISSMELKKK